MKCQEFELVVVDLVRASGGSAEARAEALAHAGDCGRCAGRLEAERALSSDLRALAARTAAATPPPGVEAGLLAAFRALEPAPAVVPLAPKRANGATVALAAAAAVAWVVGGVVAYRSAVPTPAPAPEGPRTTASVPPTAPPPPAAPSDPKITPSAPPRAGADRDRFRRVAARPPRGADTPAAGAEVVTDYFPLVAASDLTPADGGQIVRVELPRSALAPLGFQIESARADRPITADVFVGHDGVARAIRFVNTTDTNGRR